MPFDPTNPQNGQIVDADFLRAQFNSLKALDDAKLPVAEKGAANGVASLDVNSRLAQPADWSTLANKPAPVPDGTYTMGFGTQQNGIITVVGGIITAIQEAINTPPAGVNVSGFADPGYNGGYQANGTAHGKTAYQLGNTAHWLYFTGPALNQWNLSDAIDGAPVANSIGDNAANPWETMWFACSVTQA